MIGPHARDPKVIGSNAGDTKEIGPLACDLNVIGSDAGDPNVIGAARVRSKCDRAARVRPKCGRAARACVAQIYFRRSARLQAPDYRPLYRVKFHHSSTADDPAAARRKQQRRSRRRRRERLQRRRLRTEHLPFWRLLAVTANNNNNNAGEPAEDDADWTAFGADQMATARDLLQAEGRTLNDWVQFDEASADWVPLTLAELKQLSDGVHRGSDSTAAGDRTCPVCLEDLEGKVLLRTGCCQQQFCAACLWMHAGASRCCPLCRRHLLSGAALTTVEEEDASDSDSVASDQAHNNNNDDDDDMVVPSTSGGRREAQRGRTGPSCSGFGSFGPPSSDSTDGSFVELAEWSD
ncbi:hypothetical protein niasHT_038236 [Heterodera trifolii]|uniref:RING-type domain-containing protein n=1 Tax=Heterodera trifolii TaxID=157864 RepID=A0ABD2J1V7_9BILA